MSEQNNSNETNTGNDNYEERKTAHDRTASDPAELSGSSFRSEATSASNDPSSNSSHQQVVIAPAVMLPGLAASSTTSQSATTAETRSRLESYAAAAQTYALLRSQYVESQQRQALSAYSSLMSQPQLPWLLRQMAQAPQPPPPPLPAPVPAPTLPIGLSDPVVQAILQAVSQQNSEQARLFWQQLQFASVSSPSPGGATLPAVLQQHLPGSSQLTAMVSQTDILPQLQALLAARAQASTGRVPSETVEPTATSASSGVVAKAAPRGSMKKDGGPGGVRSASKRGDRSAATLLELRPKPVSEETKPLQTEISLSTKRRKKRKYTHESFPRKLYRLLEETAIAGRSHVISFTASGTAFRVHNPDAFARDIIPIYFRHSQYPSFQRQLSMYGFERIIDGPESGAYRHALFQQGHPLLCDEITRVCEKDDEFNRKQREEQNRKPPAT